ncbi:MAG TPA: site-specific integrase [Caldithrix sp.]|nr:site-specific integrase [Caldithrix sp.]
MKKVKAKFHLKNPDSDVATLIIMKFYFNKQRLVYSTGQYIDPKLWDDRFQMPVTERLDHVKDELKTNPSPELDIERRTIEGVIREAKKQNPTFNTDMGNLSTILYRYQDALAKTYQYLEVQKEDIISDRLRELLDKEFHREIITKPNKKEFYERFDEFITSRKQTGSILTVRKFNTLKKKLQEFEIRKHYRITFDSIDLVFYDKFKSFMLNSENRRTEEANGLLDETIAKYISSLKTFMQWALDRNYHSNVEFQHKQFAAKKKAKHEIVTLSEEELMRLYEKDLKHNPRLERVRDLFCFATFTGQRWSDIENFRKEDVKDGWWIFESYKTKKIMKVPFNGFIKPALDILRKYDYELPRISSQKFNDFIKEVGALAEINEIVTIKRLSGNQRIEIKKPKHEFMSSHMARRSCVTILLQRGMPPTTVMKLTGHTDLKTLMKYENTGDDALVKALDAFDN